MRLDILRRIRLGFQLFAQRSHKNTQRGHVIVPGTAPDFVGDIRMGQHFAAILGHDAEQPVLDGRQVQFLPFQGGTASRKINLQITVGKNRTTGGVLQHRDAAERYPQPRQQLLYRERFRQVVVGAAVQGFDFIAVLAAGTDNDDGHRRPTANTANHLDAVQIRQTKIQQHHIRCMDRCLLECFGCSSRRNVLVILRFQCRGNQVADRRIVLHNQNQGFIHAKKPPQGAV